MIPATTAAMAASSVVVLLTAFTTHISLFRLISRRRNQGYDRIAGGDVHIDEDGSALPTRPPVHSSSFTRLVIGISAALALVIAILALISTPGATSDPKHWIRVISQGLITFQSVLVLMEQSMHRRFRVGICIAISCLTVLCSIAFLQYRLVSDGINVPLIFDTLHAIACCVLAITNLTHPQRPNVYFKGREVDRQHTVSAIEKFTFGWAWPLLRQAKKVQRLEYTDLPQLDSGTRASDLLYRFSAEKKHFSRPLWLQVLSCHQANFIQQWLLTMIESFLLYGPQFCMFKLLSLLELREHEGTSQADVWFWVVALAITRALHLVVENWLQWFNFAVLAIPVRSQLSALIFEKSMKMPDIKETNGSVNTKPELETSSDDGLGNHDDNEIQMERLLGEDGEAGNEGVASKEEDAETPSNNNQSIINLLGVDVQCISNFCSYNNLLPGTILTLSIAIFFLVNLIGWVGVGAGLLVPLLFIPLNSFATKFYMTAQRGIMTARDEKMAVVNEALQGIRQIKFAALEPRWQHIIMEAREAELAQQRLVFVWGGLSLVCWISAPILLGASAIGVYAWLNGGISPAVAFTTLSILTKIEGSLGVIPTTITEYIDAAVSMNRIEKHLKGLEKQESITAGDDVSFDDASIAWPSNGNHSPRFQLHGVNISFPKGEISIIDGKTGSGKTLLLHALAGEAELLSGKILLPKADALRSELTGSQSGGWIIASEIALVSQIPWLENDSIRANILFTLPFDKTRYGKTLEACALTPDLAILPDGDLTEIGASGINLSGGQRWRVTFARALYSRAGILLLDDIFSAVDAHVGRHLLEKGLDGELAAGRTRILVTHHGDLVSSRASFIATLSSDGVVVGVSKSRDIYPSSDAVPSVSRNSSVLSLPLTENSGTQPYVPKAFVEEETRENGMIKRSVYKAYFGSSGGLRYWGLIMGVFAAAQGAILGRAWWVKVWTSITAIREAKISQHMESTQTTDAYYPSGFYISIYLLFSFLAALLATAKIYFVCTCSLRSSRQLFLDMTSAILRAPMRWHDTTPLGRILNRFVGDFSLIDSSMAGDSIYFGTSLMAFGTIVFTALIVSPLMVLPSLVLGGLSVYYTIIYLGGARGLKRLEASSKSPIFELFGSALTGIGTIRTSQKTQVYLDRMFGHIDNYGRSTWNIWLTTRWMSFRIGALGTIFSVCVAASVAYFDGVNAGLAGFALGFALDYAKVMVDTIRRYSGIELDMNSVERVLEYSSIEIEPQDGIDPPRNWPSEGRMAVSQLQVAYSPELPSVLQDLSFTIEPKQRVGIVGRTGSGKSSLTLAIFRFLEARSGSIKIDGLDISKIKLSHLRERLCIIPQDPVLFSGSIRSNLDPFNSYKDSELYKSLEKVHLIDSKSPIQNASNLDSPVAEGGLNLSQGQRQLLCLARALITKPKVLVLDEATSAVDIHTDSLIQESIREHFKDCTLLVIAHRLSTVADFDQILVMGDGKALEFDTPERLVEMKGHFRRMLVESDDSGRLEEMVLKKGY